MRCWGATCKLRQTRECGCPDKSAATDMPETLIVPQPGNRLLFFAPVAAGRGYYRLAVRMALIVLCALAVAACGFGETDSERGSSTEKEDYAHEMLDAVLWQQLSAEYVAVTTQTYRLAKEQLQKALRDRSWTAALEQSGAYADLPPAVMLDLDETVFDNTRYEARIINQHQRYSGETFSRWCMESDVAAVPGVKEFLDYAQSQGVAIIYYSSRKELLRDCTLASLRKLGVPVSAERNTLLLNDGTKKAEYRASVARHYRILLLIGDSLEDFVEGSKAPLAARNALSNEYTDYWGSKWIMLPNPMYGHWEATLYDFNYRLPRKQKIERKRAALKE